MRRVGFARRLITWYARYRRDLPWRRTRDPYRIWVSEIMLQQTRVQAVLPYYERFLARFPTVEALAGAPEAEVLACWSGLGYYSRARNLRAAARRVMEAGGFPRDYEGLRALPGIGDYTAAAVASMAFGLPHAVLDGNVQRVLARLSNDAGDLGAGRTRSRLHGIARELLDRADPGRFNQALMELGATICLPKAPRCGLCPVAAQCEARRAGTAARLPVKLAKTAPVRIAAELALVERGGKILLWRRGEGAGRMAGFWELPSPEQLPGFVAQAARGSFRHTITHHHYTFTVVSGTVARIPKGFRLFRRGELKDIPLSTAARKALRVGASSQALLFP